MADEDAEIVALIDNELDNQARARLLARLAADEALRKRYEALRDAKAPIVAAFDALIEGAPISRLRAALPPESVPRPASRPFARSVFRDLAAGIIGLLLGAGAADLDRTEYRAARRAGGLARRGRRIREPLYERNLLSPAPRSGAAGVGAERRRRTGGRAT